MAINAQLRPGTGAGGVETVLIELVTALARLDGPEEYIFIGHWRETDWLKPYLGANQRIVPGPREPRLAGIPLETLYRATKPLRPLTRVLSRLILRSATEPYRRAVPISDGFYESLGCAVVHFPFQSFVSCALPCVYNPHDLQHLHLPQFFPPEVIAWREALYRAACRQARTVVVASQWTRQDVIKHYDVNPDKVQVIPWALPSHTRREMTASELDSVREKYDLKEPFALYPAATWEHKNHLRLLEALALLRERDGLKVNLICTGYQTDFWPRIERRLRELRLERQAKFLGAIPLADLEAVYRLSLFVVIPTLFEAASAPLFEAWRDGIPVACSAVTALPEQAGGGALLFDPTSVESIAAAILAMEKDADLRQDLRRRAAQRAQNFSQERTGKAYRAVYRRAAGLNLNEEDERLLGWDWMREPFKKGQVS